MDDINAILEENAGRIADIHAPFNPITGLGSIGERKKVKIEGFPIRTQYLPVEMLENGFVKKLLEAGSVDAFLRSDEVQSEEKDFAEDRQKVTEIFIRIRCRYDFAFWAAFYVYIKNKGGGEDVLFRLTRPQRRFVERLENLRKAGKPIRLILLKARQWGGSTTSQIYMAWLQLVHKKGLNSLIIAHQGDGSDEIKDMFDRMIMAYPTEMLHSPGERYAANEPKLVGVGHSGKIHRVPQRNCKIKIGTAEKPNSCRGGDYNLVHLSEVAFWKETDGKKPWDIVRSATGGIPYAEHTMVIYESTANGSGDFFHKEYMAAKGGKSQFEALFISWFDIDLYSLPFTDEEEKSEFARTLYENRDNENVASDREESGQYLWWLWTLGTTLEAIHWYVVERAKFFDHASMAAEYPSDDIEAFAHSGAMVFDKYKVEELRKTCQPPRYTGDLSADGIKGKEALRNLRFNEDGQGQLWIWNKPETEKGFKVKHRYLSVVDVGGYTDKADWSVIVVFDRLMMMDGDAPVVVAQWYGHTDIDLLAWKAAQIAAFYDNALLVIEKNTVDKHDHERQRIDDNYEFILSEMKDVYGNLYAAKQSPEQIIEGVPKKYGFHTNVATKPVIIETLKSCIREGSYIERDVRCVEEYLVYERKPNGSYGAISGKHDDLLMTRAIGLRICFYEMKVPVIVEPEKQKMETRAPGAVSEAVW